MVLNNPEHKKEFSIQIRDFAFADGERHCKFCGTPIAHKKGTPSVSPHDAWVHCTSRRCRVDGIVLFDRNMTWADLKAFGECRPPRGSSSGSVVQATAGAATSSSSVYALSERITCAVTLFLAENGIPFSAADSRSSIGLRTLVNSLSAQPIEISPLAVAKSNAELAAQARNEMLEIVKMAPAISIFLEGTASTSGKTIQSLWISCLTNSFADVFVPIRMELFSHPSLQVADLAEFSWGCLQQAGLSDSLALLSFFCSGRLGYCAVDWFAWQRRKRRRSDANDVPRRRLLSHAQPKSSHCQRSEACTLHRPLEVGLPKKGDPLIRAINSHFLVVNAQGAVRNLLALLSTPEGGNVILSTAANLKVPVVCFFLSWRNEK